MGKPVIIRCRLVPKGICVNLFGTLWARETWWIDRHVVNHERIHTAQQREMLFLPFYIFYLIEWAVRFARYRNWSEAYMNISFEREAYTHGHDLGYLSKRPRYAWLAYLRRRT